MLYHALWYLTCPLEDINPVSFTGINSYTKQFNLYCCNFAGILPIDWFIFLIKMFVQGMRYTYMVSFILIDIGLHLWQSTSKLVGEKLLCTADLLIYLDDKIYQWQHSLASQILQNKCRHISNAVNREGCIWGRYLWALRNFSNA